MVMAAVKWWKFLNNDMNHQNLVFYVIASVFRN